MTSITPRSAERLDVRRAVLVGALATVLCTLLGLGAWAVNGDLPRGTRILGVDLGGLARNDAEHRLREHLTRHGHHPVRLRLDGHPVELAATEVGLRVEVALSVGRAIRGRLSLIGHHEVPPVVLVDRARLESALRARLNPGRVTVRPPAITFAGREPRPTYPRAGLDLDVDLAIRQIRHAWPVGAAADVPLVTRTPATTAAEVDALIDDVARPAVAASVTVRAGRAKARLSRDAIARSLVFRADPSGRLTPVIDPRRLGGAAADRLATLRTPPRTARIAAPPPGAAEGQPRPTKTGPDDRARPAERPQPDPEVRTVARVGGESVDLERLAADLLPVLREPAPREVTGILRRTDPGSADADLAALGIREPVATFTTYFTGGRRSPRSQNIVTIAARVDGAIVRPGETFSLNAHTGERNYAAGYRDAPVIVGGRLEPGVGGGASQFATTLFNAAYYAGLEDIEHKPHSFYFSRYPAVIESTIFYPTLDLKFRNTTPYGILIDTATTGRSVTVAMWGTRLYDSVVTEYGPRRRPTSPATVHRPAGPRCLTSSGLPGFTQDAWRVIRKDSREVERQRFTWRYDPEPRFVCGATPKRGATP
ncbi:VanW family protein [Paractinoplanes rishiriensis]|uniref:Vanomycin resistance protein VanB n=1 Tax=Paractinoplanes rishiriensis TaxID=1050105 RepID=A0A919K5A9_9ACTN|nr:VanW family protein [Actinoplanes rishiriensis]GIE99019.1 vanomycin resistance protein VanB [Actinoplanes rishiriensis]